MLKQLRIQNFKGWKDTGTIRMAPISLFFGANSSGKSSIGQFLMMLKQTVESPDRKAVFSRWSLPDAHRVAIISSGESYEEFPTHDDLKDFDRSDRKFVAVANAHVEKPPILQATDSKWWGWKDALADVGIIVQLLCSEYVEAKYAEKMGT